MNGSLRSVLAIAAMVALCSSRPAGADATSDQRSRALEAFDNCVTEMIWRVRQYGGTSNDRDDTIDLIALCQRYADPHGSILVDADREWEEKRAGYMGLITSILEGLRAPHAPMDPGMIVRTPDNSAHPWMPLTPDGKSAET